MTPSYFAHLTERAVLRPLVCPQECRVALLLRNSAVDIPLCVETEAPSGSRTEFCHIMPHADSARLSRIMSQRSYEVCWMCHHNRHTTATEGGAHVPFPMLGLLLSLARKRPASAGWTCGIDAALRQQSRIMMRSAPSQCMTWLDRGGRRPSGFHVATTTWWQSVVWVAWISCVAGRTRKCDVQPSRGCMGGAQFVRAAFRFAHLGGRKQPRDTFGSFLTGGMAGSWGHLHTCKGQECVQNAQRKRL